MGKDDVRNTCPECGVTIEAVWKPTKKQTEVATCLECGVLLERPIVEDEPTDDMLNVIE